MELKFAGNGLEGYGQIDVKLEEETLTDILEVVALVRAFFSQVWSSRSCENCHRAEQCGG